MRLRLRTAAERPPVVVGSLSAAAAAVRLGVLGGVLGPLVLGAMVVEVDVATALPLGETGFGPPAGMHAAQRGFLVQVREWPLSRPFCRRKAWLGLG